MEKIKSIISSSRTHGEDVPDVATKGHKNSSTTGTSAQGNTSSSTAGNTASGNTTYPKDSTTTGNTNSGYSNTGNTATGNMTSSYPKDSSHTTSGYTNTGNTATSMNNTGNTSSGYTNVSNTTAGNTAYPMDSTATGNTTSGYNSTGLGSHGVDGSGNTYVEDGLTRGFQSTDAAGNVPTKSGMQSGNISASDNAGSNAGYQNTYEQHLGRDAAALGVAGGAGEGAHLHRQKEKDNVGPHTAYDTTRTGHDTTNSGYTTSGTGYNTTSQTGSTGQRLGHDTVATGTSGQGSHLHRQTGRENLSSDAGYNTYSTDQTPGYHLGRDAAVLGGAGAAGAAGAAVYHHNQKEGDVVGSDTGYTGKAAGGTSGAYQTSTYDPAVNISGKGHIEDSHYHSRAHGGGAEAADRFHRKDNVGNTSEQHSKNLPEQASTGTSSGATSGPYETTSSGHHLGRDTAVGAGVVGVGAGAAGLAEQEHRKHDQTKGTGAESTTSSSGYPSGNGSDLPGPAPNTAGPHNHDWLNKLDPRVNANPDAAQSSTTDSKSSAEGKEHRYGRDAALGAGVGGVGGAAYGADKYGHTKTDSAVTGIFPATKDHTTGGTESSTTGTTQQQHHDNYSTDTGVKSSSTAQNQSTGTGYGSQSASATGNQSTGARYGTTRADNLVSDPQYGRDAAVVGGRAATLGAAAALGGHEHQKHERSIPLTSKTAGRDVDNSYQSSGIGRGNTGTTTATTAPTSRPLETGTSTLPDRTIGQQPHYGRDAAIGAGGVGATGIAAHELHKHDGTGYSGVSNSASTAQPDEKGVSGYDTYGSGISSTQHGGGQHYSKLPSGAPSGIDATQFDPASSENQYGAASGIAGTGIAASQLGSQTTSKGNQYEKSSGMGSGQFSSEAPSTTNQYGSTTSDVYGSQTGVGTGVGKDTSFQHTMPGSFPGASQGLDAYGNPIASAQGSGVAATGASGRTGQQGYHAENRGPTTIVSDETGHTKLHKEGPLEHLVSGAKKLI